MRKSFLDFRLRVFIHSLPHSKTGFENVPNYVRHDEIETEERAKEIRTASSSGVPDAPQMFALGSCQLLTKSWRANLKVTCPEK